jgi:DNA-binding transcriptional LysR family regulator
MTVAQSSGNRMVLDRARTPSRKQLNPMIEVRHVSSLLELVKAGLGIAVVPQLALPTDSASVLRSVALKDEDITRTLGVIRRSGRVLSAGAQNFYEMLKDAVPR